MLDALRQQDFVRDVAGVHHATQRRFEISGVAGAVAEWWRSGSFAEAGAITAGEDGAGQGKHGDAHPESLAGGQAAGVGKRIERDVDGVVGPEQLRMRCKAFDITAPPAPSEATKLILVLAH